MVFGAEATDLNREVGRVRRELNVSVGIPNGVGDVLQTCVDLVSVELSKLMIEAGDLGVKLFA